MNPSRFTLGQRISLLILPRLTALVIMLIGLTLRFEVIAEEEATPATPPVHGIYCFWHQCTFLCAWYFRKYHTTILISRSYDGELIARTLELLGYKSVRGSSSRGGATGLLQLASALEREEGVIFTADGPRGPIYQTKLGPIKLAERTGAPIGSFYLLAERAWTMRSWDRFTVPKPFSRVAVSWARSMTVPPIAPGEKADEEFESYRIQLNDALERARLRAEAHFDQGALKNRQANKRRAMK